MEQMKNVFVSGTFSGETLSIAAALATIKKLQKLDVANKLKHRGKKLFIESNQIISNKGFSDIIKFEGNYWWPRLVFKKIPIEENIFITLFRQQLISNGLFMGSSYNLCLSHDKESVFKSTIDSFSATLSDMQSILNSNNPKKHLKGALIEPVFKVR